MTWRPRRAQGLLDPAWRLLGLALILPTAVQVATGNLLFLGDLDTGRGAAWATYQLLAMGGLAVGIRIALDGRWRGAALIIALAWIGAHIAYDVVLTDSFIRFGERVVIARPWVFGESIVMGAWLAGLAVVGGGLAVRAAVDRVRSSQPATRRVVLVGVAAMLRGR